MQTATCPRTGERCLPLPAGYCRRPRFPRDLFAARFGSCLNLAAEHNVGPHLDGVINRRAGVVAGFNASIAFSILDCAWTRESQADFIASPAQFARGITMADMESLHRKRE